MLAEERLKELCMRYRYKFPEREMHVTTGDEALEESDKAPLRFPSIQDQYRTGVATVT